jgi:hypothetical protein
MSRLRTLGWRTLVTYGVVAFLVNSLLPAAALGAPIVGILSPTDGAVVSAKTSIDVAFRSDSQRPIICLEIYVDDALAKSWKLATPKLDGKQSFAWDFTFSAATTHRIAARAIDSANQAGSATITVTVRQASTAGATAQGADNIPPVVNIYYPAQGAHVSKTTQIKADATGNAGVKSVFLYIDGKVKTIIINAPPFVDDWDTTRVADGPHVLQARAMDAADNEGISSEVTVIVDNHNMTTLQNIAPQAVNVVPQGTAATGAAPPVTQQAPVAQAPVVVVPGPSAPQTNDQQVARGLDTRSFGTSPAPVADRGAYELSVARPLAASSDSAALASATRVASIAGSRMTLPDGVASTPLAVDATIQRGDPIASGWAGGLPTSAMPQSVAAGQIARISEPGTSVVTAGAPGGDRPGEIAEPAGIGERYALVAGSRTSVPEAQLPPVAPIGQRADIETSQGLIAALPTSASDGLSPQRTSIPSTSVIRPTQESASALLDRPEVLYVQPILVLHPQAEVAVFGSTAPKSTTPGTTATTPHVTGAASPATLAQALPVVAPKAATGARQSARLAMLPRTEGERITIPGQPSGPALATTPASEASVRNLKVLFDNKELAMRAQPELRAGIPMTALREIFQKMDGVLYWYPVTKQVRAVSDKADISLRVGSKHATINKQATTLQIAPYIKCGRTMVPLQFIADTLDVTVTYNPKSGQIVISNNKL